MLSRDNLFSASSSGSVRGASLAKPLGLLTVKEKEWQEEVKEVQKLKMRILLEPLNLPEHLKVGSFAHGMTPLHVAVAFGVLPYERIFRMLDAYPEANRQNTTEDGHNYSCIQLHDCLEEETEDQEEWQAVKELLYSYNPLVDSHRRDEELLHSCSKLVRNEISGCGSFHLIKLKEFGFKSQDNVDLNKTLSEINASAVETPSRLEQRRREKALRRTLQRRENEMNEVQRDTSSSFVSMIANKLSGKDVNEAKKSIYDDDLQGQYVVSPQQSMDDEDGHHSADGFSNSDGDEVYDSDDETLSNGDLFSETLGSDAVSQTLSQTLSFVQSGTYASDKSLLRKAIADKVIDDYPPIENRNSDHAAGNVNKECAAKLTPKSGTTFELSPVGIRLWCFFVAYNNRKSPKDNYLPQVQSILEDLEFDVVEKLIDLAVPECAVEFIDPDISPLGLTMRDIASPTVKALFESYYYFLGRYEFSSDIDGVLLHRSSDNNTVCIRATEHCVKTTEYQPPKVYSPGVAEESIWNTGEMVRDEEGYMASEFNDKKRQVCFKFTRSKSVYDNEISSRSQLGMEEGVTTPNHILPLFSHFSASDHGRYKLDVKDERFRILNCYGGEYVRLADYSYALVYPHSDEGDLFDYFFHQGAHKQNEVVDIALQVAKALKLMHDRNVVHRKLSMRSIRMLPFDPEVQNPQRTWVLTNLSSASCDCEAEFMGAVSPDGSVHFETGLLPPEMLTKVSLSEEKIYKEYWEKVETIFNIKVDQMIKEPCVDASTGCSYVVRCHYTVGEKDQKRAAELPELPYMLVEARESADLWCLGLLLYTLCSDGRPLFPVNVKSGHLLDYHTILNWNMDAARANIYENIDDPIAQDLLLKLLSPFEERNNLTMEAVISHPFFSPSSKSPLRNKIVDQRTNESAAHMRNRMKLISAKYEYDWLASRTVHVNCWNFDMLKTFHFSSSDIIRKLIGSKDSLPSSFIMLPYKLSAKNKKGKLSPTTKRDVERAERMGVLVLSLAKTLSFGSYVEEAIEKSSVGHKWDAVTLLNSVSFPSEAYEDLKEEFYKVAADHIEAFRADPRSVVTKLVERRYFEIKSIFNEAKKAFLYLVDEYMGVPLVGNTCTPYPFEISGTTMDSNLTKILPFMHACSMVVRVTSGGISGIVRLIFEAAFPHVPPSWTQAGSGLMYSLNEEMIKREILLLHRTLSGLKSSRARRSLADDLADVRSMCIEVDVRGDFANLHRVQCSDLSLWTSPDCVKLIQDACDGYDFKQALKIQADLESKLTSQEQLIKQLQEKIDIMNWHKELNLNVPDSSGRTKTLTTPHGSQKKGAVNLSPNSSSQAGKGADVASVATTNSRSTLRDNLSVD
ncbi:unnamed protein product [Pseudo-nitzschia multistriata]|uniref:Protein kinase domain-containing protein n=1 Tax=Pseudo-nitzschia multistriata TaxID=183589 RepID=A0A448Z8B7_9STRA|nr:unnamed protein product [Pseudo-nitzschia multistriata]